MTDKLKVHSYLRISVVSNDSTEPENTCDIGFYFCLKLVTLKMDCVLAGTNPKRMTGHGVWEAHRLITPVLPLGMAVLVSLLYR